MLRPEVDGEIAGGAVALAADRDDVGLRHALYRLQLRRLLCLGGDARIEFVPGDDETLVAAFADRVDAVVRLDLEGDAVADDFADFNIHPPRHFRPRGRQRADAAIPA